MSNLQTMIALLPNLAVDTLTKAMFVGSNDAHHAMPSSFSSASLNSGSSCHAAPSVAGQVWKSTESTSTASQKISTRPAS